MAGVGDMRVDPRNVSVSCRGFDKRALLRSNIELRHGLLLGRRIRWQIRCSHHWGIDACASDYSARDFRRTAGSGRGSCHDRRSNLRRRRRRFQRTFSYISTRRLWLFYLLLPWALAVCYSRPILRVHAPTDILIGGLEGILLGFVAFLLVRVGVTALSPRGENSSIT